MRISCLKNLILPASNKKNINDKSLFAHNMLPAVASSYGVYVKENNLDLITHTLSTVVISQKPTFVSDQCIIAFNGNNMCYEVDYFFNELCEIASLVECNVIGFNYRNVAGSTGSANNSKELIADGIAQIERILEQGVDHKKILIYGHSLGGGIGAEVYAHYYAKGMIMNIFTSRTFSTLSAAAAYIWVAGIYSFKVYPIYLKLKKIRAMQWFFNIFSKPLNILRDILYVLGNILILPIFYVIKFLLYISDWELRANLFATFPDENKYGIYVQALRDEMLDLYPADDELILFPASLVYALTKNNQWQDLANNDLDKDSKAVRLVRTVVHEPGVYGHSVRLKDLAVAKDRTKTALDLLVTFAKERFSVK